MSHPDTRFDSYHDSAEYEKKFYRAYRTNGKLLEYIGRCDEEDLEELQLYLDNLPHLKTETYRIEDQDHEFIYETSGGQKTCDNIKDLFVAQYYSMGLRVK